jgi:hypothetical protein
VRRGTLLNNWQVYLAILVRMYRNVLTKPQTRRAGLFIEYRLPLFHIPLLRTVCSTRTA